jgi:oligopeptide/dipeptide ABC transporter ATP-binding protein
VSLLEVRDLEVSYSVRAGGRRRLLRAVDGVTFDVAAGETYGLVGESGSGKSTTGRAVLCLVEPTGGTVAFDGQDLAGLSRQARRSYRRSVQVVFQDPFSSLNPRHQVGRAIGDLVARFTGRKGSDLDARVCELMGQVGLNPDDRHRYPHEFSGGQRQRIAIARALAPEPDLIVCDEPVSALDVSTQSQVVNLLEDLKAEFGLAMLFIAHDLSVVRHVSDRIGVMYLGRIVETGDAEVVYSQPAHPYTAALMAAIPVPDPVEQKLRRLLRTKLTVTADPPSPLDPPTGCAFHPRCPFVMDVCREVVPDPSPTPTGEVRCHLHTSGPVLGGASVIDLVAGG